MGIETDPNLITPVNASGDDIYDLPDPNHEEDNSNDVETKYKVPQKYIKSLKVKMKELQDEATEYRKNFHDSWDSANAQWYEDMSNILQDLITHLESGNNHDMKLAQLRVIGLTNDAVQHIPNDVYNFIIKGDDSLKVYFQRIMRKD